MSRSCPEELGKEKCRQGTRGTAGRLDMPRGEGVGEAGQTGPRRRVGFSPGGDRSQGRVSSRTEGPESIWVLGSSIQPGQEAWIPAGGWCFHQRAPPAFPRRTERDGDRRERPRGCSESGWEKNAGPLVPVSCLQHQEGPVWFQESRPLPYKAFESVPPREQD